MRKFRSMASRVPPPLNFSNPPAESFAARMDRQGNPCFACGARNPPGLRSCRSCHEPLPSALPLSVGDALRISTRSYERRATLQGRQYVGLGCLLAGMAILAAFELAPTGGWAGFGAFVASIVLAAVGIALFVVYQGRVGRMIRVQVLLFGRQTTERRARQPGIGGTPGPLSVPLTLDGVPPQLPLAVVPRPGAGTPATGRWASALTVGSSTPVQLRRTMQYRGEAGVHWHLQDARGRRLATVLVDRVMNRVFQLTVNDPTLGREYWLFRDAGGQALGRFVSEARVDDRAGRAVVRLGFYDTDGSVIVRMEGGYTPLPRTVPQLIDAYQGLKGYDRSSPTTAVFRVAPGVEEGAFRLLDASGAVASEARTARPGNDWAWVTTVPAGPASAKALLATFAVAQWQPDGSTFGLARALAQDPELAARVDAEVRGIAR